MMPTLLALLLAVSSHDQSEQAGAAAGEYRSGISVARIWESDPEGGPDLRGYRAGFVALSKRPRSRYGFAGSWYAEWKRSPRQTVGEGGLELAYPYVEVSRFGLGPRVRVALQRRNDAPARGVDLVLGAGFEVGVWLSPNRAQLVATADRSTGLVAGPRTSGSLGLRVILWNE